MSVTGRHRRWLLLVVLAAALVGCSPTPPDAPPPPSTTTATVAVSTSTAADRRTARPPRCQARGRCAAGTMRRAVDGDTVTVRLASSQVTVTVRLIGVDTPETHHPRKPPGCWGPEAAAYTTRRLQPGTRVWLEWDAERRDHYGRYLAYLWARLGLAGPWRMVNAELVLTGAARVLPIPPNLRYQQALAALQRLARAEGHGLWSACQPSPPPVTTQAGP